MTALITMPARTHLHPQLELALKQSGLPYSPLYGHTDLPRARSWVLSRALRSDADVIVSVDADVIPSPDALLRLSRSVGYMEAVTGLYVKRDGSGWAVRLPGRTSGDAPADQRFPIEDAGLGFCAFHRSALEAVAKNLPTIDEGEVSWSPFCVPEFSADGKYWADDDVLWKRLREAGAQCYCDPTLRAAHVVDRPLVAPELT